MSEVSSSCICMLYFKAPLSVENRNSKAAMFLFKLPFDTPPLMSPENPKTMKIRNTQQAGYISALAVHSDHRGKVCDVY